MFRNKIKICHIPDTETFLTSRALTLFFTHSGHWHFSHITNFDTFRTPTLLVWIRENVPEVHIPDSAIPSSSSNASLSCSSWGWRSSFSLPSSTANRHWKREQDADYRLQIIKTHTVRCRCKPNPSMVDADINQTHADVNQNQPDGCRCKPNPTRWVQM